MSLSSREQKVKHKNERRAPAPDRNPLPGKPRKKAKVEKPFHVVGPRLWGSHPDRDTIWHAAATREQAEEYIDKAKRGSYFDSASITPNCTKRKWWEHLRVKDTTPKEKNDAP